ncbi:hypothetical protein [Bacillus infantis]|uniref:hypothetical protein n=1 Tax=Bacillus infantis TaxID=324767 RepID=UPI003CF93EED
MATSITPISGHLGIKSDRSNLLSYSITTDGTMSTITEKVNGVVVGTKTATSGQSLIAGLTQEQWDAIRYGKYTDVTGGKNTLTVEMGSDIWTYTFEKRVASTDDINSAIKAVKDSQEVYLPTIKKKLVNKVGGNVTDSFEGIIQGISLGKKFSSGTVTNGSDTLLFEYAGTTSTIALGYIQVTGLGFRPSKIELVQNTSATSFGMTQMLAENASLSEVRIVAMSGIPKQSTGSGLSTYAFKLKSSAYVDETGFLLPVLARPATYNWYAYE